MPRTIRILAVHGVGGHEPRGAWTEEWSEAIEGALASVTNEVSPEFRFVGYDDVFRAEDVTLVGTLEALGKLLGSGVRHGAGSIFGRHRGRGVRDVSERVRWTAGMVVQWVESERIRRQTRRRLADAIAECDPHVICAHSLGSLVAYDTFTHPDHAGAAAGRTFVSLGSQIGNAFVRGQFGGRIEPFDCRFWYHLFNPADDVFTAPLRIAANNFQQVQTAFDIAGFADHDATEYLMHANAVSEVWRDLAATARFASRSRRQRARVRRGGEHRRRALLVGINEYPNEEDRLEGCVNDVFLTSALLQEHGFAPEEIRTVLDDRATAEGIRERLTWLLDGAGPGDERFFYYSGHGAQITDYGADEVLDRKDECLVAWDFDWSPETAITDDWFHELYSQLPYDTSFHIVLDCCHSGGMTRAGGGRPRGLDPPDDIRHRELEWDAALDMWRAREPRSPNRSLARDPRGAEYLGKSGVLRRLGRGTDLLPLNNASYERRRKRYGHFGPFLPVILQACQEHELAYEYRHGASSYGAFTYSLAQELRAASPRRGVSFATLMNRVGRRLDKLGYEQKPNLVGPSRVLRRRIPWRRR